MSQLRLLSALLALTFASAIAFAHEEFRVIGTLTRHEDSKIEIQSRDGKTTAVKVDKQTLITRDGARVDVAKLIEGLSVVVDVYGDTPDDSLALEIRIVPPIAPAP